MKFLPIIFLLFLSSCLFDDSEPAETQFYPVLMDESKLDETVYITDPIEINKTGKFYLYPPYLLVNELFEGIHIIDNSNIEDPKPLAFLRIPGNQDIAVRNNILYADNARDLLSIDIRDPENPVILSRQKNVFPELVPPDLSFLPEKFSSSKRPKNTVIIKWVEIE